MKKTGKIFAVLFIFLVFSVAVTAANPVDDFEKYEYISTPERTIVGIDATGLVIYGKDLQGVVTAYDARTGSELFALGENQNKVASFFSDGTAVITGKEGYTGSIISKDGTILAQLPEGYAYSSEFANGLICLIDKSVAENVYSIIDRRGNIIVSNFYAPECELESGEIIITNAGGGYSIINSEGEIKPFECRKTVSIEDAVSRTSGIYVGIDGHLYTHEGELIFKNFDYGQLSPIYRKYALAVKNGEEENEHYVIDIKEDKIISLEENEIFNGYIYSGGNSCMGRAFVGNSEQSVLVDLKSGKVISSPVTEYTKFYYNKCAVALPGEEKSYRFLTYEGDFVGESYIFGTDFSGGYALAVEERENDTAVYAFYSNEEKYEIYNFGKVKSAETSLQKAVFTTEDGQEILLQKTKSGNILIENSLGSHYLYVLKDKGNITVKTVIILTAIMAAMLIAVALLYTAIRKEKKYGRKKG